MVRPPPKHQGVRADLDLVSFINDFLFNPQHDPSPSPVLRRQRTPTRSKRYRSLWKAAASSLIAKRSSSQGAQLDLLGQRPRGQDELHSNERALSPDAPPRELPSSLPGVHGGDLASSDCLQQGHNNDITIDVDAAPLSATIKDSHPDRPCERSCTRVIFKHSSKKPPRPPRVDVVRSSSFRAIRLKTAARRAMVNTTRMKKQKMHKSTSNAAFIWALIITISFVLIMLVQGFFGDGSNGLSSDVGVQGLGEVVSLSPSQIPSLRRMARSDFVQHQNVCVSGHDGMARNLIVEGGSVHVTNPSMSSNSPSLSNVL